MPIQRTATDITKFAFNLHFDHGLTPLSIQFGDFASLNVFNVWISFAEVHLIAIFDELIL